MATARKKNRSIILADLQWFCFLGKKSGATKASQQGVLLTCGILRYFQAFFWLPGYD